MDLLQQPIPPRNKSKLPSTTCADLRCDKSGGYMPPDVTDFARVYGGFFAWARGAGESVARYTGARPSAARTDGDNLIGRNIFDNVVTTAMPMDFETIHPVVATQSEMQA